MPQHTLAQKKRIGLAITGDVPAMRQVRNNGLAAVTRIATDEVVEHAGLRAQTVDCARLMHVEMGRAIGNGIAQHPTALRVRLRWGELEFRTVILQRDFGRQPVPRREPIARRNCGRTALQEAAPTPTLCVLTLHDVLPPDFIFHYYRRYALMAYSSGSCEQNNRRDT